MTNPLKVLRHLIRLRLEGSTEILLKPETVAGGLEAVRDLLRAGLPAGATGSEDTSSSEALKGLASFYCPHGRPALTAGEAPAGAGDRLYRDDVTRLSEGLSDVADRMDLGITLRKARRESGYSIRELARFAGVDHSYLSRVERGAVPRPSDAIMVRLAAPLGLPGAPEGAEEGAALAGLGLHRATVRSLLKMVRDLSDEHLEVLAAMAKVLLERAKRKRQ